MAELKPAEATVVRDIISGLKDAMKHVSALATSVIALVGALGILEPAIRSSRLFVCGAILLLGSIATSLCALVLLAIAHAGIQDPGRSFVRDNRGTIVVVLLALLSFTAGTALVILAVGLSARPVAPGPTKSTAAWHANPPLPLPGVALGEAAPYERVALGAARR